MYDRLVLMPLAQMNTNPTTGPAPAIEPAVGVTSAPGAAVTVATDAATTSKVVTTAPGAPADTQKAPGLFNNIVSFLPIILMFVVLYFILIRGQRKEEKRRKGLIAELKKGDKVMTVGGLIARVVQVDGDEVVLKIDESANVKATYQKSSIQQVLVDEKK